MSNKINAGDVFEFKTLRPDVVGPISSTEEGHESFFIFGGTKVLVLEKVEETGRCKILLLTGKQAGRIGYENLYWLKQPMYYKKNFMEPKMNNKVNVGNMFKSLLKSNPVWTAEKTFSVTISLSEETKVLVLEKNTETNLCKILVLTGEETGRVVCEHCTWFNGSDCYEKLDTTT